MKYSPDAASPSSSTQLWIWLLSWMGLKTKFWKDFRLLPFLAKMAWVDLDLPHFHTSLSITIWLGQQPVTKIGKVQIPSKTPSNANLDSNGKYIEFYELRFIWSHQRTSAELRSAPLQKAQGWKPCWPRWKNFKQHSRLPISNPSWLYQGEHWQKVGDMKGNTVHRTHSSGTTQNLFNYRHHWLLCASVLFLSSH